MKKQYTKYHDIRGKRLCIGDYAEITPLKVGETFYVEVVKCQNGEVAFYCETTNEYFTHRDILYQIVKKTKKQKH